MRPRVNAIIPCRNSIETIERAVKSAVDAGCDKVFVFDDASTDGLYYKLLDLRDDYPIWTYSSLGARTGSAVARNYLINLVEGDLIICLDADDTLNDIAPLVAAWQPNTFVYGNHNEINGDTVTHHKGAPIGTLPNKLVSGVTFLFHKDDWKRVGGFDSDFAYCEDWAYMCALVNAGVQGRYMDTTVYNRYMKPEGNERTVLAGMYFEFYRTMCRRKYPNVFNGA